MLGLTPREEAMLRAYKTIYDYIPVSLGDLIDPDFRYLVQNNLVRTYMGMGASQMSTITDEGRALLAALDSDGRKTGEGHE